MGIDRSGGLSGDRLRSTRRSTARLCRRGDGCGRLGSGRLSSVRLGRGRLGCGRLSCGRLSRARRACGALNGGRRRRYGLRCGRLRTRRPEGGGRSQRCRSARAAGRRRRGRWRSRRGGRGGRCPHRARRIAPGRTRLRTRPGGAGTSAGPQSSAADRRSDRPGTRGSQPHRRSQRAPQRSAERTVRRCRGPVRCDPERGERQRYPPNRQVRRSARPRGLAAHRRVVRRCPRRPDGLGPTVPRRPRSRCSNRPRRARRGPGGGRGPRRGRGRGRAERGRAAAALLGTARGSHITGRARVTRRPCRLAGSQPSSDEAAHRRRPPRRPGRRRPRLTGRTSTSPGHRSRAVRRPRPRRPTLLGIPPHGRLRGTGRRAATRQVGRAAGPRGLPRRTDLRPAGIPGWRRCRPTPPVERGDHRAGGGHLGGQPHRQRARCRGDGQAAGAVRLLGRHAMHHPAQPACRQLGGGAHRAGRPGRRGCRARRRPRDRAAVDPRRLDRARGPPPPPGCPHGRQPRAVRLHAGRHADRPPHGQRPPGRRPEPQRASGDLADRAVPQLATRRPRRPVPRPRRRRCAQLAGRCGRTGRSRTGPRLPRRTRTGRGRGRTAQDVATAHDVFARNPLCATSSCSTSCPVLSTLNSGPVHRTANTSANSQARNRSPV
ncbi:hypothetical protein CELL_01634 [Cellulomonas sp. T2.31MG-18]